LKVQEKGLNLCQSHPGSSGFGNEA